ncbi:MAG: DUF4956 domain-containing protein [Planctomycetes bacterium]|nr:DUF4956 domain-containing protein [Planctomycetota bacterium]HRV81489.1 DUF4956 domain-containing protein [Planctomycetota bacterium]
MPFAFLQGSAFTDPANQAAAHAFALTPQEILINAALATVLGVLVAYVYRATHKGLSYSQSFTQTIVYVALVVALVMMVIGSSLARAFALVGALSIIRFRTVVKDTKDTAFVFAALALGMAAGTSNYLLAGVGLVFICSVAWFLDLTNFGALYKSEFILRFVFDQNADSSGYLERIKEASKRSNLLNIEPSGDGQLLKLTYDIQLEEESDAEKFVSSMKQVEGVSEVILIVSKNDIDY